MTSNINTLGTLILAIIIGGLLAYVAKIALDGEGNE